jgi:hypothetical protein
MLDESLQKRSGFGERSLRVNEFGAMNRPNRICRKTRDLAALVQRPVARCIRRLETLNDRDADLSQ